MPISFFRSLALICGLFVSSNAAIAITGTVKEAGTGTAIQGAIVSLVGSGLTTVSDKDGNYAFGVNVQAAKHGRTIDGIASPDLAGNMLSFSVADRLAPVRIDYYTLSGKRVATMFNGRLNPGAYRFALGALPAGSSIAVLNVKIGASSTAFTVSLDNRVHGSRAPVLSVEPAGAAKAAAAVDSLAAWAVGYTSAKLTIDNLTGTYPITLSRVVAAGQSQVLQTSQAGDTLASKAPLTFADDDGSTLPTITVTPATTYQSIEGFGAAFTECAVYNLCKVTPARKNEALNAFFNPFTGSGYTLCRATINSCDFSIAQYDYDGTANDLDLTKFDMSHDMKWMIPTIKQAQTISGSSFKLFGSPWAPPAWMKTSNNRIGKDGGGGGSLRTDCYDAWANYFVKYITTMKANGIPMWGVTIQNEPAYDAYWEACVYSAEQERDFLKTSLGPILKKNYPDVKIMFWDHNKDVIVNRVTTMLSDATAKTYPWGIAYHRYSGDGWDNMNTVHNQFPTYPMIATECSVHEGYTEAERMAHEIIGDLNHWSSGYVTWNIVTDFSGGPFHNRPAPGGVVGTILLDSASNGIQYLPDYFYMTHFSRYMRPGAVRVMSALTGTSTLEFTAVKNLDGSVVVAVLNKSAAAVSFKIKQGTKIVKPTISAHALMTFVYF
jgi:glucosylceramidase